MIKRISAFIYGQSNQLDSAPERGRRHAMKSPHIIGFTVGCSARLCRSQFGHRIDGSARAAEKQF